ncbi:WD domain, G-beta repeat protein [Ancylostoma caninum]|uniref:WD domain, G-beta repeat protein n=1 Tax=Ancylostoma caninum TaxID=29170 RepID=A0A368GC42_ANCCA|nr:WD domain, G-beta repeat protein [Ancylostoma caninum]
MATVHGVDGRLIICASSKIFSASNSEEGLSITDNFDVKCASSSVPMPKKNVSEENSNDSKNNGTSDSSCQVLCSAVSNCGSMLAIGTSEKTAMIVDSKSLQLRRAFRIPKAPTSVTFDRDNSHVVIGDRAGHVCRYTVEASQKSGYVDMNGEESPYEGEPLSSAISMVLDVAISQDGRYLLAADRDEKIRVSRYPQAPIVHSLNLYFKAFVVQSFCLGHSAYVGSVAVHGDHVFSSGGDSIVYEWDIDSGKPIVQSEKLSEDPVRRVCVLPKVSMIK